MRILEIIHLRFAAPRLETLSDLVPVVRHTTREGRVRVYRHSRVETDLLVHLHRTVDEGGVEPSDLGSRLSSLLREHGLVEHSVWIEQSKGGDECSP